MKKTFLKSVSILMTAILLISQVQVLSAKPLFNVLPIVNESVFSLDENALFQSMKELNALDDYLDLNVDVTYADLSNAGSELIKNISGEVVPMGTAAGNDALLGIPPFWWGCVLNFVGYLLVYFLTKHDVNLTKKALTGCLVGTGFFVLVPYLLLITIQH